MTEHKTLAEALAAFQADLPKIKKSSTNPHFHSKYASLEDISNVVLPALAKHGMSWSTAPQMQDGKFVLHYCLTLSKAEQIEGDWPLPEPSANVQTTGSHLTYARRYCLCAVTGVAPDEDDDGNAASGSKPETKPAVQPPAAWRATVAAASTIDALNDIYGHANAEGWLSDDVLSALSAQKQVIQNA